jgi:NAD(P)-dependent dehydrogenase (short-subunit alcohol dehydrogenase family)
MDRNPEHIIVVGASGGIGSAILAECMHRYPAAHLHATFHKTPCPQSGDRLTWHRLDVRDSSGLQAWAATYDKVDWIINCAGYLHGEQGVPEKSIRSFDEDFLIDNIRINTLPTLQLARHFAKPLKWSSAPKLATISARVGSIEDNRLGGWYSYRISKAALNMALKTISVEWKHSHPKGCVAALHPGTNDTALSKPFQANVAPENLFKPAYSASMMVDLLARLDPPRSGNFWAWDGELIPW